MPPSLLTSITGPTADKRELSGPGTREDCTSFSTGLAKDRITSASPTEVPNYQLGNSMPLLRGHCGWADLRVHCSVDHDRP